MNSMILQEANMLWRIKKLKVLRAIYALGRIDSCPNLATLSCNKPDAAIATHAGVNVAEVRAAIQEFGHDGIVADIQGPSGHHCLVLMNHPDGPMFASQFLIEEGYLFVNPSAKLIDAILGALPPK